MSLSEKTKKIGILFWEFLKIGAFCFGGGWSLLAQIQKVFIEEKQWINDEELLDITAVARSVPGVMITNASLMFGYHACGVPGALAALIGVTLPSLFVMLLVTSFYDVIRSNPYFIRALTGIRAAIVPIIVRSALSLRKAALKDWICYLIALAALALFLFADINKMLIIGAGAVAGLLLAGRKDKKDAV